MEKKKKVQQQSPPTLLFISHRITGHSQHTARNSRADRVWSPGGIRIEGVESTLVAAPITVDTITVYTTSLIDRLLKVGGQGWLISVRPSDLWVPAGGGGGRGLPGGVRLRQVPQQADSDNTIQDCH